MPQAIFQQDKVDWRDGAAAAVEGARLQQVNRFFPAAIGDVGRVGEGFQMLAQLIDQLEDVIRQADLANALLPLMIFLVADAQRFRDRIGVFILLVGQHAAKVLLLMHVVEPETD